MDIENNPILKNLSKMKNIKSFTTIDNQKTYLIKEGTIGSG